MVVVLEVVVSNEWRALTESARYQLILCDWERYDIVGRDVPEAGASGGGLVGNGQENVGTGTGDLRSWFESRAQHSSRSKYM